MTNRTIGEWNDGVPIYRQLRDNIVALILDGALHEGDALPSARVLAAEHRINPLTVLKAFQELAEEGLVESRRGLGMFINKGAQARLLERERKKFLSEEWPRILDTIRRLDIPVAELLGQTKPSPAARSSRPRAAR